jgi:flagella basal body P-ring formation protein FlgA
VAVTGAEIRSGDLARALPAFKAVPPDLPLGPSPLPGAVRMFPAAELRTIASRFSIHGDILTDICVRIATEPLNSARLIESMTAALNLPGLRIEILDTSHEPVPVGRIDFQRENLRTPAIPTRGSPVVWKGDVIYAGDRRFGIWARVQLTAPVTRLLAVENLRAGIPIRHGQVREETTDSFPLLSEPSLSLTQIEGLTPSRPIVAGAEVRPDNLVQPNDVNRGDLVHVEVFVGAARLTMTGRAESAGHRGDMVPVRNLESSRVFQARVEGADSVIVQLRRPEETLR